MNDYATDHHQIPEGFEKTSQKKLPIANMNGDDEVLTIYKDEDDNEFRVWDIYDRWNGGIIDTITRLNDGPIN